VLDFGQKKAFTLIELLVVIAIIALLLSILMPSLSKVKLVAKRIECQSNMKNLVMTQVLFAQSNDGYFAKNTGIYPDYVKNPNPPNENIHTALYSYDIGKLTVCKIYASYFREDAFGDPTAGDSGYGGWDSGETNIFTPYFWFANLKRYEFDTRYGIPTALDGGKSPWPNRVSDASSMAAMMTHRVDVLDPTILPFKGHGTAEVNLTFEMPVVYGDGHLETHKRGEIKARGKMKTAFGESVFAY
jgi:prepilin-type N-terminal cleavage/methylation domain-containing protein